MYNISTYKSISTINVSISTLEIEMYDLCTVYQYIIIRSLIILQFHGKISLSTNYVSNWIGQHCPRMVHGLQRYVIHVLTTAYRNGKALLSKEQPQPPIEIPTPVLEKSNLEFPQTNLLPISYVWLLSCTLPQCYLQVCCRRVIE